jgi:hypothetical protein
VKAAIIRVAIPVPTIHLPKTNLQRVANNGYYSSSAEDTHTCISLLDDILREEYREGKDMQNVQDGGELLKVLYATIGKRPTKILAWIFAVVALILAFRYGMEGIDWLFSRFAGSTIAWPSLLISFIVFVMMLIVFLIIAFLVSISMHIAVDRLQSNRVNILLNNLIILLMKIHSYTEEEMNNNITELLDEATKLKGSSIWTRILTKLNKQRK